MSFIPGMVGPAAMGVPFVPPLQSVSLVYSRDQRGNPAAIPSWPTDGDAVQLGDAVVIFATAHSVLGAGGGTPSTPAGFDSLISQQTDLGGGNVVTQCVSKRLCDGTETGQITGVNLGGELNQYTFFNFRGTNLPIASFGASGWTGQQTSAVPSLINLSSSGIVAPCVAMSRIYATPGSGSFNSVSPAWGQTIFMDGSSNFDINVGYTVYDRGSSPSSQAFTMTDNGLNFIAGGWLVFA